MSVSFCAYPWDLVDDPRAVARVRAAGGDGVALAAAYHSVRAATPLHPAHRIVDAPSAALYLPVRAGAWGELRPDDRTPWIGPDAFARAAAVARDGGLRVEAWIVLTHSTAVGTRHPGSCVVNAFGETYPYALCPTRPEVREYATALVAETVAAAPLDGVLLEACGPMGVAHLGHHEKTAGADWSADAEALLSICFCGACAEALRERGADPDAVRGLVRARIDAGGGLDGLEAVLAVRAGARRQLLDACVDAARSAGVPRVAVHAQSDPWGTGPFAALLDDVDAVDGVVVTDAVASDPEELAALRERLPAARVGGWMWALPPATPASIRDAWPAAVGALDDTYVYHLGLVGQARLDAVVDALAGPGAHGDG